LNVRSVG